MTVEGLGGQADIGVDGWGSHWTVEVWEEVDEGRGERGEKLAEDGGFMHPENTVNRGWAGSEWPIARLGQAAIH